MQFPHKILFEDLYKREGLCEIHRLFLKTLEKEDPALGQQYKMETEGSLFENPIDKSAFLIKTALLLEKFLTHLFSIEKETAKHQKTAREAADIFWARRNFVMRYTLGHFKGHAVKNHSETIAKKYLPPSLQKKFSEARLAAAMRKWFQNPDQYKEKIEEGAFYTLWALKTKNGQTFHKNTLLFKTPEPTDFEALIPWEKEEHQIKAISSQRNAREGFTLTDKGPTEEAALIESHACIWCHTQEKDSCRKGFKDKEGNLKTNPLGNLLQGCPLDQKISEMHFLMARGHFLAAAAIVMIDNPLLPLTGHRICNDCSKACIFQKQTPIDIPAAETRLLDAILSLPYGFEIYSLLTRWNPLLGKYALPLPKTKYNILVAGAGPAGIALSYYLMRYGHRVTAVDGLKIEPLQQTLVGFKGRRPTFEPIYDVNTLYEPLDKRIIDGFGGVAEYGITSRWNKNYLKIVRLILERNTLFSLKGGVRIGSNLGIDEALKLGFDHVALCLGAGKPKVLAIPGMLIKGVRQASDFLMALQLQGASRFSSTANLMIRLPIAVVGGGLTAIDAATEALALYPVQLKKFKKLYKKALNNLGQEKIEMHLTQEEKEIRDEFLAHEKALSLEKKPEDRQKLIQKWGGVRLFYKAPFTNATSYRLNHHEVKNALEEGVRIEESTQVLSIKKDMYGSAAGLVYESQGQKKVFPARTVLVAVGTEPNTTIDIDTPFLEKEGNFFKIHTHIENNSLHKVSPSDPGAHKAFLTHVTSFKKGVSVFGDLHPAYYGSVVKAIASAKNNHQALNAFIQSTPPSAKKINVKNLFTATVEKIIFPAQDMLELTLKAPFLARKATPGQLFRLHPLTVNIGYETEGIPLTYYSQNKKRGTLTFKIALKGASTKALSKLQKGMSVSLMGPTGNPLPLPEKKNILFVGKGCDMAFASLQKALEAKKSQIKTLSTKNDLVKGFQDFIANGQAKLYDIIYFSAPTPLMAELQKIFKEKRDLFHKDCQTIALLNSPMQCMMKGVCAACLQKVEGVEELIYACRNQTEPLENIDFQFLENRLNQNSLLEKIMNAALEDKP